MKILVIGGSVFLGRAFVQEAIARGHNVSVFNRGKSGPDIQGAENLRGDRENSTDLEALAAAGPWDAVIDTSGFHPRTVGQSARALSGRAGTYLFVSSFHAYADWPAGPVDEGSARHVCPPDAAVEDVPGNALKAGCERAVEKYFEGDTCILNPGLIVGPRETPGRLLWWLERTARGGEVLAPGRSDRTVQLVDARDIAVFGLDLLEASAAGRFLVTGPKDTTTLGELLELCARVTGAGARPVWADEDFLMDQGVGPWTELPFWALEQPAMAGAWEASPAKAVAAGLRCRPLAETVADTWEWLRERGPSETPYRQGDIPLGIDPDKEREVLRIWQAKAGA
ncbi:NAD-dependent epimerase/dehydratase family protein [Streptomyces corynorhini]|uniref:NAD-dependent epimerase/dehydratase family protein n=1 Tax=Streptomyces corynorhini TaxID=2282652 RepID=A0A370BCF9_9ACTN|nr:NAD-dependent epimerase/dehydratase family protein [Streptomyces corynorhini]RDG37884.1 NAD-dependent epimerase/dehydratase family protein [Streptomyces corynorhini]